jgi:hypothetical protein
MANALFELGRQGFLDGSLDWDTNTFKVMMSDFATSDTGVRVITSSTNATPVVVTTAVAHGFTTGDLVLVGGVATGLSANGIWAITAASGSVFSLTDPITGANVVGSGVGAGGYAINLGASASGDNIDDFDGSRIAGTTDQTLTSPTVLSGVANAAGVTFTAVTGNAVKGLVIYKDTGTASTSRVAALIDGRMIVTCAAAAASSSTTIAVERLPAGIPNGTVLTFSNGAAATLSALANAGDRTVTVTSTAALISAGNRADAPATASGLPVTPNGGNISIVWDTGVNRIFKL